MTYRVFGEVSDENVVSLELTLVDTDGEVRGSGRFTFPLDRARTAREALSKVIRHQVETIDPHRAYTVEEARQSNPQAYGRWTEEEEVTLLRLHDAGASPAEISAELGRKVSAIGSRLVKLGRIDDWSTYGASTQDGEVGADGTP